MHKNKANSQIAFILPFGQTQRDHRKVWRTCTWSSNGQTKGTEESSDWAVFAEVDNHFFTSQNNCQSVAIVINNLLCVTTYQSKQCNPGMPNCYSALYGLVASGHPGACFNNILRAILFSEA